MRLLEQLTHLNQKPFRRFLDTAGDGSGTTLITGNYSVTAENFFVQPAAGEVILIYRMILSIEDGNGIKWEEYGGLTALTNGIQIRTRNPDEGVTHDLLGGLTVKSNANWAEHMFDFQLLSTTGGADDVFHGIWSFEKFGQPLELLGTRRDRFEVAVNDNFTGLIDHRFKVEGLIFTQR